MMMRLALAALMAVSASAAADTGACTEAQCCSPIKIGYCKGNTHSGVAAGPSCTGTATDTTKTCDLDAATDSSAVCPAGCTSVDAPEELTALQSTAADFDCTTAATVKTNAAEIVGATVALCCDLIPVCAAVDDAAWLALGGYEVNAAAGETVAAVGTVECAAAYTAGTGDDAPKAVCASGTAAAKGTFTASGCTLTPICTAKTAAEWLALGVVVTTVTGETVAGVGGITYATGYGETVAGTAGTVVCATGTAAAKGTFTVAGVSQITGFCEGNYDTATATGGFSCSSTNYVAANMQTTATCTETATTSVAADKALCEATTAQVDAAACAAASAAATGTCTWTAAADKVCPAPASTTGTGKVSGAAAAAPLAVVAALVAALA